MARGDLDEIGGLDRHAARARGFRLLAVTVTALVAAFAAVTCVFLWYDSATQRSLHTQLVRAAVGDVLQELTDIEAGQRAYLLTHEPHYLAEVEVAKARVLRRLSEARELTRDNPEQIRRLEHLTAQAHRRLALSRQIIAIEQRQGLAAALQAARQSGGRQLLAGIRQQLREIDDVERGLQAKREHRAATLRLLLGLTILVFGAALVFLFFKAIRDLSLDREAEAATADRLRELVRQRTLLLDEVNHRVKNSLQQIAGVVRLQSRAADEPQVRQALEKTLSRIMAVGRVHEQVYKAEGRLGVFDAGGYADGLARDLVQSMGRDDVILSTDTEAALLDLGHAGPIALILNELITNALKYGCPGGRPCALHVRFQARGGEYRLSVADDGPGMPPGVDPATPGKLGLRAVEALARQLGGRLEISAPGGGADIAVVFPARAA